MAERRDLNAALAPRSAPGQASVRAKPGDRFISAACDSCGETLSGALSAFQAMWDLARLSVFPRPAERRGRPSVERLEHMVETPDTLKACRKCDVRKRQISDQPPVLTAACSMAFAALLMGPVSFWVDSPLSLDPTAPAIAAVIALGVFSTAIAMAIYFRLVHTLGPLGVSTGSYLRAGFSVVLGVVLLGEALSPALVAGLVMILGGVAIVTAQQGVPTTGRPSTGSR